MNQQTKIARLEKSISLQERTLANLTSGPVQHEQAIYTCKELIAAFKADLAAVRLGFRNSAKLQKPIW